jgi:hypothetical protein
MDDADAWIRGAVMSVADNVERSALASPIMFNISTRTVLECR